MAKFVLIQEFEEYRDYEPENDLQINGYTRITFDTNNHTAYGTLVDSNGDTEVLSWADAADIVNTEH